MLDIINNQGNPNDNHNVNHHKLIEMAEKKTDNTKCEDNEDEETLELYLICYLW